MTSDEIAYFDTLCPVVRNEILPLWQRFEAGGQRRAFPFTKRILWVRESTTKLVLRWDRAFVINQCGQFCDFYGYLTSLSGGVDEDAARVVERLKLTPEDRLSVDCDVEIQEVPVLLDESAEGCEHNARYDRKRYLRVPGTCNGHWWCLAEPGPDNEQWLRPPVLEPVQVISHRAIWSSAAPINIKAWIAEEKAKLLKGGAP